MFIYNTTKWKDALVFNCCVIYRGGGVVISIQAKHLELVKHVFSLKRF